MLLEPECMLAGSVLDVADDDALTALHHAALNADAEAARLLLACGASVQVRADDEMAGTALHMAVAQGSELLVERLLKAEQPDPAALLVATTRQGHTALHGAATLDRSGRIVELLLRHSLLAGAPFSQVNADDGFGALHYAARHDNVAAATVLLAHGADVHATDYAGASSLDVASWHGHEEVLSVLTRAAPLNAVLSGGVAGLAAARHLLASAPRACDRPPGQRALVSEPSVVGRIAVRSEPE